MPKSRSRGVAPFPRPAPPAPIVIDPKLLADAKTIAARVQQPVGAVISACIRYTLNMASSFNQVFPFAAALNVQPAPPANPEDAIADPDAAAPEADEDTTETAEERLAKNRAIARGEAAEAPTSERETPVEETPIPSR